MRNTCLAVAATGGHEALRTGLGLSIEHLFDNAATRSGVTAGGATMTSIRDGIVIDGQCESGRWPYGAASATPRPVDLGDIHNVAAGQLSSLDLNQLRNELTAGRALVLGLFLNDHFLAGSPLPIRVGAAGEQRHGRHSVLVVGYNDDDAEVAVKNSWGTGWGNGGYGTVAYEYLSEYGIRMMSLGV